MRFQFRRHLVDTSEQCREGLLVGIDDRVRGIDDVELHCAVVGIDHALDRVADVVESLTTEVAASWKSA